MARPGLAATRCIGWVLVGLMLALPAAADPALEQRVARLTDTLRCLVCQNQTLADSHAQLALDLKQQVREQLAQGASDDQVLDYMVQRYGDFVLYRPPLRPATWVLWFGPLAMLLGGAAWLLRALQRMRRRVDDDEPIEELAR